jgi:membrane protease YdiL (CAAX protease family)
MNRVHEQIRQLPPGIEFVIVILWAFGIAIFSSILSVGLERKAVIDDQALLSILIFELLQFAFLAWFLRIRGWTLAKIGLEVSWRSTGIGVVLAIALFAFFYGIQKLGGALLPDMMASAQSHYPSVSPRLSMELVFIVSVVNGFFEEIFVAGYAITALAQRRGLWLAINVSTVIRMLYHLYQGPLGVILVVPMGLVMGYLFARTGRLWPLILAHILVDVAGLSIGAATQ